MMNQHVKHPLCRAGAIRWISAVLTACCLTLVLTNAGFSQDKKTIKAKKSASTSANAELDQDTKERFRVFKEKMTGTRLTGKFTVSGAEDRPPTTEQYDIVSVRKLDKGDLWEIKARIRYQKNDITVPMPIEVKWAGNTPVLTVDRLFVPGLGTFDARVLLRKDKYAGTWAHGKVGGHLFGTISKIPEAEQEGDAKGSDKKSTELK